MPLHNSAARYGSAAKILHWLTAAGIMVMIPLGIIANGAPQDGPDALAWKVQLFSAHKTLGIAVFAVAVLRIVWAMSQPKPAPLHPDRMLEHFAAETVHKLLYGSLLLVPISGWIEHAATSGFAPILWPLGQNLPFVPQSPELAEIAAAMHIIFERVLVISLILHIGGALKHAVWDRDQTLARMLPGETHTLTVPKPHEPLGLKPVVAALVVWIGAIGIGAGLGLFAKHPAAAPAELAQVASDWNVESGAIDLTVQQFGNAVSGQFSDWTAAIRYEPEGDDADLGQVDVEIAIASVSLGSVTAQALGGDYFDAAKFPTARFTATLSRVDGVHQASGTLTLRGQDVPVAFPFELTLDGNTATMTGMVTLDRRAFGIGEAMQDAGQLGFAVDVALSLTATRP
ncbi:cytochrome b/b6 domain-containing protein [Pelagimonas varians]|uniref:Lipid/polyisoprenoid-binding YceI-like domain-containing protein n=1 Tax=Pelagimonas varians TaxID=696760 RepID=A0A238JSI7_9RHOB|nr:cytochrome b/b6 domain-containing protein [Pelagimonas varians]PYG34544.1 cytochrome b561 [Pelagimonas varians]SMX33610.1 hypothetical protein PEV8663_00271 [Pelagimonas varians]